MAVRTCYDRLVVASTLPSPFSTVFAPPQRHLEPRAMKSGKVSRLGGGVSEPLRSME
jgi:hypothetical protein